MADPLKANSIAVTRCAGCGSIHVILYDAAEQPIATAAMPLETAVNFGARLADECEASIKDAEAGRPTGCEGLH